MRRHLKTSVFILAGAFCLTGASSAFAAQDIRPSAEIAPSIAHESAEVVQGAENFINSVASRGIGFLSNEGMTMEQRRAEFRSLLRDSFDMPTLGRFALGKYWKVATPAQQQEYLKLFEKMVVEVYSNRFNDYNGQSLEVRGSRAEGNEDTMVSSYIIPPEGSEIQVDWRVRYKKGRYKVVDIIVAGVSMAMTQRSDFASVIQRGGGSIEVLLEHLRAQYP
jgi:phospholipid transport system substrate-binding protein